MKINGEHKSEMLEIAKWDFLRKRTGRDENTTTGFIV